MSRNRVLVLGLDGGDLEVFRRLGMKMVSLLEDRGRLASLQQMWREDRGWAMILCGRDASFTGGYYWAQVSDSYLFRQRFGADHYRSEPLWTRLDQVGLRAAFVSVPTTFPPQTLENGFFIAGAGGGQYPDLEECVRPVSLLDSDGDLFDGTVLDVRNQVDADLTPHEFIQKLLEETATKERIVSELFDRHGLDFAMTVFVGADRIQHLLWPHLESAIESSSNDQYGILRYYQALDETLVRLIERYSNDCHVIVCADHGFAPRRFDVSVNRVLAELEFQHPKPGARWSVAARLESWLKDRVGERARRLYRRLRPWRGYPPPRLDWQRTDAFVNTASGVWVNTEDRFPHGSVPSSARRSVVDRLVAELKGVHDPRTERPLFSRVVPREEAYEGPEREKAPDVLFTVDDTYQVVNDLNAAVVRPFRPAPLDTGILPRTMSGIHGPGGIFGLTGPDVTSAPKDLVAPYTEVHDVILALFGLAEQPSLLTESSP